MIPNFLYSIMEIDEKYKNYLKLLNDNNLFPEKIVEDVLESCCTALSGQTELYDKLPISPTSNSETKQVYASLLHVFTQFVRNSQSSEDFLNFLITDCSIEKNRSKTVEKYYEKCYESLRIQLLNIGNHLPHITDVRWKIDYVAKSNALDKSEGPIFRVSLKTEKYDQALQGPRIEFVEFTCTSQEMQDLVYKLKDAVRHCSKIASGH